MDLGETISCCLLPVQMHQNGCESQSLVSGEQSILLSFVERAIIVCNYAQVVRSLLLQVGLNWLAELLNLFTAPCLQ